MSGPGQIGGDRVEGCELADHCGLDRRIDGLTRQLIVLKVGIAVAVAGAILAMWHTGRKTSPGSRAAVSSRRFTLTDREGRAAGIWTTGSDGSPSLVLLDPAGGERVRIDADIRGGAAIAIADAGGRPRVGIGLAGGGEAPVPRLELFDPEGRSRCSLALPDADSAGLVIRDRAGRDRATLAVLSDGSPALDLARDGRSALIVGAGSDGSAFIRLRDGDAATRVELTVTPDGNGGLHLRDRDGADLLHLPLAPPR